MPSVGPLGHSLRIIATVWCLSSVVLVYLYSGCLTSFITIPKLNPAIESLDDLMTNTRLKLTILKNSVYESIILVGTFFFQNHFFVKESNLFLGIEFWNLQILGRFSTE